MDKLTVSTSKNTDQATETQRKVGQKMSDERRRALPFKKIINMIAQFIRGDYGGKSDKVLAFEKKAREWAEKDGAHYSDKGFKKLAEFAVLMVEQQLEGCRMRVKDNIEEAQRRAKMLENSVEKFEGDNEIDGMRLLKQAIGTDETASDNKTKNDEMF